jgi:hypothetical protein
MTDDFGDSGSSRKKSWLFRPGLTRFQKFHASVVMVDMLTGVILPVFAAGYHNDRVLMLA